MKKIIAILILIFPLCSFAQVGGSQTYPFLRVNTPARVAALGDEFLSINDNDLSVAVNNPSLITDEMNKKILVTAGYMFSGTSYQAATLATSIKKFGNFTWGIQNVNYGVITITDEGGEELGKSTANDMALQIGWGKAIDSNFSIGANMKGVMSFMYTYFSYGFAVDVAASYYNDSKTFSSSLFVRNLGSQIYSYNNGGYEPLPFEIDAALSTKLKHAPFRFSVLLHHLERWDMAYDDPVETAKNTDMITGEVKEKSGAEKFFDNAMRHVVLGVEFLPTRTFSLQLGYNYDRRKGMVLDSKPGMTGFSFGAGLNLSKFQINYAHSAYSKAGAPNYITVTWKLSEL